MNRIIEAIKQIIEAAVANSSSPLYFHATTAPQGVKIVYFGDPIQIPESCHPAICVQPADTNYEKQGSRYDTKTHLIEIRLVDNIKNYLATSPSNNAKKVMSVYTFAQMMEKSDANQKVNALSICGLMQNNQTLPYLDPENSDAAATAARGVAVRSVNYVFNTARGYPTYEAICTVEVTSIGDR